MSPIPEGYEIRNGRLLKVAKRLKYGNQRTEGPAPWGGTTFYDSKKEADYARTLADETHEGNIKGWMIQPSFVIAADDTGKRIRMRPDFLVIHRDGTISLIDTKGMDTRESRMGRAVLHGLGLTVIIA
jgi:hypothetical protein